MTPSEPVFACDLTRLSAVERERLLQNCREIFAQPKEVKELPDGFALGFPEASPHLVSKIGEFIAYDRLCCSFLRHELVSEPHGGTTWLRLTGEPGAKEFISADLTKLLAPETAR